MDLLSGAEFWSGPLVLNQTNYASRTFEKLDFVMPRHRLSADEPSIQATHDAGL